MAARLRIRGIPFSLFYDYDQLRDGNLSKLTPIEKVDWFVERHEHVFLRPQKAFWSEKAIAGRILKRLPPYKYVLSAKLVMFGGMLNACEGLGGFMIPTYTAKDRNWKRFETFVRQRMSAWDVSVSLAAGVQHDLVELLWKRYRNAIAHGFHVAEGGIEYLPPGTRYSVAAGWLKVCPQQLLRDYEAGFRAQISTCRQGGQALAEFVARFQTVYPC